IILNWLNKRIGQKEGLQNKHDEPNEGVGGRKGNITISLLIIPLTIVFGMVIAVIILHLS
ncbi:MAG: hypothetical protein K2J20_06035, partial [Bacilli bacterium]|nr:hypothetical protein [Bacilli bacterium]